MSMKRNASKVMSLIFLSAIISSCARFGIAKGKDNMEVDAVNKIEEVKKEISLNFPIKGEEVNILKPQVLKYINAMHNQAKAIENDYVLHDFYITGTAGQNYGVEYSNDTDLVRVADYCNTSINEEKSKKVALIFDAQGFNENTEFTVTYGLKSDLSDGKTIKTTNSYACLENLLTRKTYYWKVSAGDVSSSIESFTTPDGFRMMTAAGINNIRDMGGRPVYGGKHIKQGLIYRGGEMVTESYPTDSGTHHENLTEENIRVMREVLNIEYEIDFRGDAEANNIVHSPLYDENDYPNIEYLRIPAMSAYDYIFDMNASTWAGVKNMFLAFKNAEAKHVYFHCWGGADRTGTTGFLLGGLLGMSYTDLIIDFELTSFSCNYRPHNINDAKKIYRFPSLIYKLKTVKNDSGDTYYSPDKPISTLIEEILIDKAGLTKQDITDIRNNLLED